MKINSFAFKNSKFGPMIPMHVVRESLGNELEIKTNKQTNNNLNLLFTVAKESNTGNSPEQSRKKSSPISSGDNSSPL